MTKINLLDPSLGIQTVMDSPISGQPGIPAARQMAANVLREAGLEELYAPNNAEHLVEQLLCPDVGDGDLLRPEVFSTNLGACVATLRDSEDPNVRRTIREDLAPLLENTELLKAYTGLMIGG